MKDHLIKRIDQALRALAEAGELDLPDTLPAIAIDPPRNPSHGDLSCNIAMLLAKACRKPPLAIAEVLSARLRGDDTLASVEVAPPGFINFRLRPATLFGVVEALLRDPARCGRSNRGAGLKVQLEFVSANPTGPLHVGHGRGAAYGAALANMLRAAGYDVATEYYVNDAGRQMDILALSVWLRCLERGGIVLEFPPNAYRGAYILEIASELLASSSRSFVPTDISWPDFRRISDEEEALDARIAHCRATLGEETYRELHGFACQRILDGIRDDLAVFGVEYDCWYSERSLLDSGLLTATLARLRDTGYVYEKDGAEWLRSTSFGDEKDRVLVRENGAPTYFASDVAYHADKFARGFERVVNIWGADHHGYIPRVKASLQALGHDPARLEILLVQFASLFRGGHKVQMSTRSGEFVTLRELIDEVGADAARYFYSSRRSEQHLDFDLDLAKAESQDNPVYYLQYAHARICSVFRQVAQQHGQADALDGIAHLDRLAEEHEHRLALLLSRYAEVVGAAAAQREPHAVANFLRDLATEYHAFYNAHKINVEDAALRHARLALCGAVRLVLADGLHLLGVSAPQEM
ncbi:MAG: arginine--tRNA ligase [Gammaproteobacteria bacterium]